MTKTARDVVSDLLLGVGADSRKIDEDLDYAFAEFDRAGFAIVPKDNAKSLVDAINANTLVGLVMTLTGGSANPNVVSAHIDRIRSGRS